MHVLICEDNALLRDGLTRLFEDSGHDVSALADASGVVDAVTESEPHLVVMDVRMPPTYTDEGIRAAMQLRTVRPTLPILVLSQYVEERYATELIAQNATGLGYLLKDRVADVGDFLISAETVASGGSVLDPEVVAQLLTRRRRDDRLSRLTDRERDVLALMAEGQSNQRIATSLFISEGSVEKHISSLFTKLELEQDSAGNRRVLAVLAHIGATPEGLS